MTSRRNFLRIAGTSAVILAAGAAGLTQCDPMPDAAVEAWKGPLPSVRDPRVRALSFALLAPNPHNMQPWIADLREPGAITFFCDRSRLLPETDPYSRQITIGCGAFLELLRMGAAQQGFRAEFAYFPAGEWPEGAVGEQPLCRVSFVADPGGARDPLFAHVLARRTNRGGYERALAEPAARSITSSISHLPVNFSWTADPAFVQRLRNHARQGWRIETGKDSTYFESVKVYRLTGEEILKHRDGLSFHGPFFWWMNKFGLFTQERALTGDAMLRQQSIDFIDGQLEKTPSFGWLVTSGNDRRTQLSAGAAYVRVNLQATALGLSVGPLSQVLQEFPEMLPLLAENKKLLGVPDSNTVQMFFRIGSGAGVEPAPRRPLDAIIRS